MYLIASLGLLFATVIAIGAQPGIVTVSSEYLSHRVSGTGSVTKVGNRYFVKTASHVSQGTDTRVIVPDSGGGLGAELSIVGRISNILLDVEVLEVKPRTRPIWGRLRGFLGTSKELEYFDTLDSGRFCLHPKFTSSLMGQGAGSLLLSPLESVLGRYQVFDADHLLVIPPWSMSEVRRSGGEFLADDFSFNAYNQQISFPRLSYPATSGSPLVRAMRRTGFCSLQVAGLNVSYSNYFRESHFASAGVVAELIGNLISGKSAGYQAGSEYQWIYGKFGFERKGLEYSEVFRKSPSATVLPTSPAGNGDRSDGGNGDRSDGGGELWAHTHSLIQNSRGAAHPLSLPGRTCDRWSEIMAEPGIAHHPGGKLLPFSLIGFARRQHDVQFTYASLLAISRAPNAFVPLYLSPENDLVSLLKKRLDFFNQRKQLGRDNTITAIFSQEGLTLAIEELGLRFSLNRNGGQGDRAFRPFLCDVSELSGMPYVVDLRPLFFFTPELDPDVFVPYIRVQEISNDANLRTHQFFM